MLPKLELDPVPPRVPPHRNILLRLSQANLSIYSQGNNFRRSRNYSLNRNRLVRLLMVVATILMRSLSLGFLNSIKGEKSYWDPSRGSTKDLHQKYPVELIICGLSSGKVGIVDRWVFYCRTMHYREWC